MKIDAEQPFFAFSESAKKSRKISFQLRGTFVIKNCNNSEP
jgi:hypothetical protein